MSTIDENLLLWILMIIMIDKYLKMMELVMESLM